MKFFKAINPKDPLKGSLINALGNRKIPKTSGKTQIRTNRKEKIAQTLANDLIQKNQEGKYINGFYTSGLIISSLENFLHDNVTIALLMRFKDSDEMLSGHIKSVLDKRITRQKAIIKEEIINARAKNKSILH